LSLPLLLTNCGCNVLPEHPKTFLNEHVNTGFEGSECGVYLGLVLMKEGLEMIDVDVG
jgi:hypothetical protein